MGFCMIPVISGRERISAAGNLVSAGPFAGRWVEMAACFL
jgi:hypothetical protein